MPDWNVAQWIVTVLLVIGPIFGLFLDGKPRDDPKWRFSTTMMNCCLWACLLALGGFWS